MDTPHLREGGEMTQGAKRQRITDLVSPTAADKKSYHRKLAATDTHGQPTRDANTTPAATQIVGGDGKLSYAEAANAHHSVVVLDRCRIPLDELRAVHVRAVIERALYGVFMDSDLRADTRCPQFMTWPRSFRGGVRYTPRDDYALAWLTTTVECTPVLWEGSGELMVVAECKVPRHYTALIYIPDFGRGISGLASDRLDILIKFLVWMNSGVGVERWRVFAHEMRLVGDARNHLLVVGITPEDVELLRRKDFRLHYVCARVYVKVRGYNLAERALLGPAAEGENEESAASSGETAPPPPGPDDHTTFAEDLGWTMEDEERLLEAGDVDEDDISL